MKRFKYLQIHNDNYHTGNAKRGVADGIASLDASGYVPLTQLSGMTNTQIAAAAAIAGTKLEAGWQKDVANGIASLSADGFILAPGSRIFMPRDGAEAIYIGERTTNEVGIRMRRTAAYTYEIDALESASWQRLLTTSMKDIAGGIAGLDAGSLLAMAVQRVNFMPGTFTWDTSAATGNQAVTGIGFTPRILLYICVNNTAELAFGWMDAVAGGCIINKHNLTANTWAPASGGSMVLWQTIAIYTTIQLVSFDADGFTLSFTKTGAKTGTATVLYVAVK